MYEFVRTFRFVAYVHKVKTIDKKLEESEKVRKDIEEQMSQLRTETTQQVGNVLFFFLLYVQHLGCLALPYTVGSYHETMRVYVRSRT